MVQRNGGDMLELVHLQKREPPKAAGAESDILNCEEILWSERNKNKAFEKHVERMRHSVRSENTKNNRKLRNDFQLKCG